MCVCVWGAVGGRCTGLWRPEEDTEHLALPLSTTYPLEAASSPEPGAHCFPANTSDSPLVASLQQHQGYRGWPHQAFYIGADISTHASVSAPNQEPSLQWDSFILLWDGSS